MVFDSCPYCGIGKLHAATRTHVLVYADTLIHIPNIPTQKCDVCGQYFFEDTHLRRFEVMIGEAGPPPNYHRSRGEQVSKTAANADALHNRPK